IRRTLRIREGDPLEIFTDREGQVILKKYSPIGELNEFSTEYAMALYDNVNHSVIISDRDSIIAVAGASKKEYMDKRISPDLERTIENRDTFIADEKDPIRLYYEDEEVEKYKSQVITPIVMQGDPIGAVVLFSEDEEMGDLEIKLTETAASFLSMQMEN